MGSITHADGLKGNIEYEKMLRGEMYHSFGPEMTAARRRCAIACSEFNATLNMSRRRMVELWRNIIGDKRPLPSPAPTAEEDEALFIDTDPWVEGPIKVDYGIHLKVGPRSFINFNFTCLDTCPVTIGARVLFGPNVSIYTASHPVDPAVRMGIDGPECGKDIDIGDDCWIGGQVIILPGVVIGKGCTVGAGSVVTKSVEPFSVVAGNPARVIKKLPNNFDK